MHTLEHRCINTIRFLAVDMVERAQSGHPGMPLGAAPMAYVLWDRFLKHNPANPSWPDRDRFVLSAGHGSALLYALLHLTGYDVPLAELQRFRQWGSKTPGHPERGLTSGVEATTGPLGQGFAMGVGMAMAECFLAAQFNRPGHRIVDHYTYALVSDGDLMEGVASEAASLAGALRLGKLIYLYDDNHISIEGETDLAFTEDVRRRFETYGWHVQRVADGEDMEAIDAAIRAAQRETERPSLVMVRTHIGFGSPKQDSAEAHGEPLGEAALRATKERFGWPLEPAFYVPDEALSHLRRAVRQGARLEAEWLGRLEAYRREYPDLAAQFEAAMRGELPPDWDADLPRLRPEQGPLATREASGRAMNALARRLPTLTGGSGDLAPSTKTLLIGYGDFGFGRDCGANIHFGVREHAMGAIVNGMALHGGVVPYGATFLVFSDYLCPALRLAALMQTHVLFLFTHDSIALGEDGPTHQPVEQLMSLRHIPGLTVLRPADANETVAAWRVTLQRRGPVALTRQKVPVLDPQRLPIAAGVPRGAYVLADADEGKPDIVLIATGSEVHLALAVRERLAAQGIRARVVSMPSWELFDEQSMAYRHQVLPPAVPELADRLGWLTLPEAMHECLDDLKGFAAEIAAEGMRHVVLLGMGGSSLAPEVLQRTYGNAPGHPELVVLDSTHPAAVRAVDAHIDLRRTLFAVSSKSGTTTETLALFRYFWHRVSQAVGTPGRRFIAITDPGTPLGQLARERGFRRVFEGPPDVGGRYAALSVFGLVPAALIGLDVHRLLDRAWTMAEACAFCVPEPDNACLLLGASLGELALAGRDKATFLASRSLAALPDWLEQLIAESTGKDGTGILPVVGEPPGPPEVYGTDRCFVYLHLQGDAAADLEAGVSALEAAGHPVGRIHLTEKADLGQEFFRWEVAVAAGAVLGIHPFNQPDVELAKDLAERAMVQYAGGRALPEASGLSIVDPALAPHLQEWLKQARPGDYVALQAYLAPTAEATAGLQAVRTLLRDRLHVATTVAYGPRFLHSTGQLHKGGSNTGLFLQLVADSGDDLPVPETDYTFGALIRAQSLGDYEALQLRGRRVLRVHLRHDVIGGLERLAAALSR